MKTLQERFEQAVLKEESSLMEEAFSEYLQILKEASLADYYVLSHLGTKLRKLDQAQVFVDKIKGIGAFPHPISSILSIFLLIVTKFGSNTESKEKLNMSLSCTIFKSLYPSK